MFAQLVKTYHLHPIVDHFTIALLTFGRLALIAPAANLVAVPLVPPLMAAGAVAFGAGWLAIARHATEQPSAMRAV